MEVSKIFTFRMRLIRYPDEIAWLESMPEGERSEELRIAVQERYARVKGGSSRQNIEPPSAQAVVRPARQELIKPVVETKVDIDNDFDLDSKLDALSKK